MHKRENCFLSEWIAKLANVTNLLMKCYKLVTLRLTFLRNRVKIPITAVKVERFLL